MTDMRRFIERMPKAELHVHVEGTLEPELKFDLARRNGIELPYQSVEEMRAAYDFDDLPSFLRVYYEGMSVLLTEQDFHDLTTAYLTKAHSQNVLHAEMFFDPQAHTTRGIAYDTVIRGIRRAQVDAQDKLGIRTQLIMCFLREMSAESAMATLEQSLAYKDWIVGVGLDSDEKGNPPIKFKAVFARARAEGYRLTMHCDVDQENSIRHIRQTLDDIGSTESATASTRSRTRRCATRSCDGAWRLTVCPISNSYLSLRQPQGDRGASHAGEGHAGNGQLRRSRLFPGLHEREPRCDPGRSRSDPGSDNPARRQRLRGKLAPTGGEACIA